MENGGGGEVVRAKRAEIDTRKPFRSVKEAVTLFGDKVLAGELYTTKLKQIHGGGRENNGDDSHSKQQLGLGNVRAELLETKQILEKAKEDSMVMAHCLSSLQDELQQTKKELQLLKERDSHKPFPMDYSQIEDVKVVEDSMEFQIKMQPIPNNEDHGLEEFQKKRYVTFANPPAAVAQVQVPHGVEKLERLSSLRKERNNKIKKAFIPLIAGIFSKKKGNPV